MNLVNGKMPKEQPLSVPTDSSFLLAQSRVAWLFNSYRGQLSQTATTDVAYELTLNYDQKLLELHDDMPYFSLRSSPDFVASQHQMRPQWLHAARHIFVLNVLQKRLLLHRHFFALSLQNSAYAKSRALTIESALGILAERRAFSFPFDDVLDTLYNTLTASVALVIDLLCQPAESPTPAGRLQEIEELLCMLRIPSRIPSKHVQKASSLLDDLMLRYRQSTGNMLDMTTQQFPLPWTFPDSMCCSAIQ